jgi:hypothetical protein
MLKCKPSACHSSVLVLLTLIAVSGVREHENAVIDNIFQPEMFML